MISKKSKKIINYPVNYYSCQIVVNKRLFAKLAISQYYQTKKGRSTVTDEIIRELAQQLHNEPFLKDKNDYYNAEPLFIGYRAYNLIWDYDNDETVTTLLIIDCYRERKYDKKD